MTPAQPPGHTHEPAWGQALQFAPMTPGAARTIADTWKYPAPYDFYDATADAEDYQEFITPELWAEHFWQVRSADELVGFLTAQPTEEGASEISLGIRPDLTGAGRGSSFLGACLDHLTRLPQNPNRIMLSVASFNQRAIRTYEAVGFRKTATFQQPTNGGVHEFIAMELSATSRAGMTPPAGKPHARRRGGAGLC